MRIRDRNCNIFSLCRLETSDEHGGKNIIQQYSNVVIEQVSQFAAAKNLQLRYGDSAARRRSVRLFTCRSFC